MTWSLFWMAVWLALLTASHLRLKARHRALVQWTLDRALEDYDAKN